MTAVENKKFKVKDDMTVYTITSVPDSNRDLTISWTDENGNNKSSKKSVQTAQIMFDRADWYYLDQATPVHTTIKSDGGSSSYYELTITNKAGESIKCETGDVIRALVGNDFDFGNCVKALRRMYLATLGMGKEGTDLVYDANKIRWFLGEIERVNK